MHWLTFVHYGSFCFIRKSLENLWARKGEEGTNGKTKFPLILFSSLHKRNNRKKIKNGDASRSESRARPWSHYGSFLAQIDSLIHFGSFLPAGPKLGTGNVEREEVEDIE